MASDLLLAGALAAAAGTLAVLQAAPPPAPPPPVEAVLSVVAERISSTRAGVVVVPVEIDNRGEAVTVAESVVDAQPVRSAPATTGATRVAAQSRARFVVIVEPDCLVLGPSLAFVATAAVTLRTADGRLTRLSVDVGRDPAVRSRLDVLCGPGG